MLLIIENENTLKSDFGSIWLRNFIYLFCIIFPLSILQGKDFIFGDKSFLYLIFLYLRLDYHDNHKQC